MPVKATRLGLAALPLLFATICLAPAWNAGGSAHADDPWTVLPESESRSLYDHLRSNAYVALDQRRERIAKLDSKDKIRAYQQSIREQLVAQLGGFPEKTPLRSETVGVIKDVDYRIEKVIYESQPNHHITANLYLPSGKGPFPGVVVSSGHSRTGKTADYNQRFGIAMAKHGMAALCFDPIGQGERSQILDANGRNLHSGTTTEHFLIGVGSTLVGRNTARYRIWDAMRSIDYLQSRKEIDPAKIGMTGCSGGGTLTSYVMALDVRVVCAAPACYLTTFRRLLETIGPQDAEQNIFAQLALGIDQTDYVLLRAPRPTLISSTTQDFFPIEGSWETFREAKQIYGILGFPERVDLVESDAKHGVTPQNLATITHWMSRWLGNQDRPIAAQPYKTRPSGDLLCTSSGQVLNRPDEKSVMELNAEYAEQLAEARAKEAAAPEAADALRRIIRSQLRLETPLKTEFSRVKDSRAADAERSEWTVEKWILRTESLPPMPTLVFQSKARESKGTVLFLHDSGKQAAASPTEAVARLIAEGNRVIAIDLPGQGETSAGETSSPLGDWKTYYMSYLMGDSLTTIRARAIVAAIRFASTDPSAGPKQASPGKSNRSDSARLDMVAVGKVGIAALFAATLEQEAVASLQLQQTPHDWLAVVEDPNPVLHVDSVVHGALLHYDLPDLARLVGEGKVNWDTGEAR